jgi:RNA polymerase primary sigma factor
MQFATQDRQTATSARSPRLHPALARDLSKCDVMRRDEEQTTFARLVEARERGRPAEAARLLAEVERRNLRLVVSIAAGMATRRDARSFDLGDLIGYGYEGLRKAAENFDHQRGIKFATFATYWIRAAIRRAIMNDGRTIRLPIGFQEQCAKVDAAQARLARAGVSEPSEAMLAAEAGLSPAVLQAVLRDMATVRCSPDSLDRPLRAWTDNDGPATVGDALPDDSLARADEALSAAQGTAAAVSALDRLTGRERVCVELRAGIGDPDGEAATYAEIGEAIGLTRERARQIEQKALAKMRRVIAGCALAC